MKIQKLFLPILVLSMFFSGSLAQAQSKSEKKQEQKIKELEKKLQHALKLQEVELQKALEQSKQINNKELHVIMEDRKKVHQKAKDQYGKAWNIYKDEYSDQWEDSKDQHEWRSLNRAMRDFNYKVISPPDLDIYFEGADQAILGLEGTFLTSTKDRTALTIQKDLEDITFDTKFKYEVTEKANGLNFRVSGSMDEGTLLIKLVKPSGDILQEIEISPLADINWNQDLRWDEEDEKEGNVGSWLIEVSAKGATGNYHVNVRAN